MTKETKIVRLARMKNGRDFDKWINSAPSKVTAIDKLRAITKRLDHSMVDETAK